MYPRHLYLFIALFVPTLVLAQKTAVQNTLLWRIDGKGLSKPSYLFGTIHLTDKRVFHFGDSLYRAIERTDGFAAEVDLHRAGMQMVNHFMKQEEENAAKEPVLVKNVVDASTWEKYKEQLSKKLGKPSYSITVDDLEDIEDAFKSSVFRKGEMSTFVDAHLFGIARSQGKWIGGIEDFSDQIEHINAEDIEEKIQSVLYDDEYFNKSIERIIDLYLRQDLDGIDMMMYRSEGKKDFIMIKRNVKMARRIDSLSAIRSSFFAVGAAHLPGDSGVIKLLRDRGFTLTPVFSSKKINPDKYKFTKVKSDWETVQMQEQFYSVMMPGVADKMDILETLGIDARMYFDIAFMKMYMTMTVEIPESRSIIGKDSLFAGIRDQYKKKGSITREKNIRSGNIEGKEYVFSTYEGELRMQIFMPELKQLILNAVFAYREKELADTDSEQFFRSLAYKGLPERKNKIEKDWTEMTRPELAFSIEWPVKPREVKDVKSIEGKITYDMQHIDIGSQIFYGLQVTDIKEGMNSTGNDSVIFQAFSQYFKTTYDDFKMIDSSITTFDGYPAIRLLISGKVENDPVETKILLVSRGNRTYYVYTVYAPIEASRQKAARFVNSMKFTSFKRSAWRSYSDPANTFTIDLPVPLKPKKFEEEDELDIFGERFIAFDSIGGISIVIDKAQLPEWLWFRSDSALISDRARTYEQYSDTMVGYTFYRAGNTSVADFSIEQQGNHLVKRVRIILTGGHLYEIVGSMAKKDLESYYEQAFASFKAKDPGQPKDRTTSRVDAFASALLKSTKRNTYVFTNWWPDIPFTHDDLPALQKMFMHIYPDFDTLMYSSINSEIFKKIKELDTSHTMVPFLRKNYPLITEKNEYVKIYSIALLSSMKTKESYDLIRTLLNDHSFTNNKFPYIPTNFYDSLELTATLFPDIYKHLEAESLSSIITSLTVYLLDSNKITPSMVRSNTAGFMRLADKMMQELKESAPGEEYFENSMIQVLGILNTPESNAILKKLSASPSRWIRFSALIALLKNDQKVDQRDIYTLATTDEYRHDLYDELKKMNKLSLFPKDYMSVRHLAQSKVFEMSSDDFQPSFIDYLSEKKIVYKGKEQRFLLYKVSFDDGTSFLGVAGPYSLNIKDFNSSHDVTGIYWDEDFDKKQVDRLFAEYLKLLEEDGSEDDD